VINPKQQRFVDEYLVDLNATKAAIRAGYSEKTAGQQAFDLLKKPEIQDAIEVAQKSRQQRTHITQDRVLQELARIAFFDPRKLLDESGNPRSLTDLDDDTAAAVAGLDLLEEYRGSGDEREFVGYVKKFKIADKNTALTNAMRHLGMLNDKLQLGGGITVKVKDYTGRKKEPDAAD
jgi:phage terminase small subunit